jgi:hypothetical protein
VQEERSQLVPMGRSAPSGGGATFPWLGPVARLERELGDRLASTPVVLNPYGFDPFGFHPETAKTLLLPAALSYRYYFRVETHGCERVPSGPVLLIANHSGQVGYDGMMLSMAMLLDAEPPRLCRGMGEFFFWKTPWLGTIASRLGTMAGTPENCTTMLRGGACVAVFPEGARGANKPWRQRYQLQRFGTGFMRSGPASCGSPSRPAPPSSRSASSEPRSSSRASPTSRASARSSVSPPSPSP